MALSGQMADNQCQNNKDMETPAYIMRKLYFTSVFVLRNHSAIS